ncbi:MAG: glycosyltransferase [Prochlorococcus marinus CUG1439]|uniref:glycosyltransferase n=1 Tax=Prochlorococcus sp. MIT 1314 TaxID=3096220 RepID=UPI001B262CC3|nr:glycosyltransferase [Prochlorococcus sp. MIT 1314]MCR8538763.1 glycosyltransferase [Prochlorococcus marinus CUG1439]
MKILIYLEQSKILEEMISQFQVNPGLGGTTYTSARLALELQQESIKNNLNYEITLFTNNPLKDNFFSVKVLGEKQAFKKKWDIVLLTGNIIEKIYKSKILIHSKRKFIWSRHPFDKNMIKVAKKLKYEFVSVGKNQYLSNYLLIGSHNHIDNLFCSKRIRKAAYFNENFFPIKVKQSKGLLRIGYMGALVPSKGFHLIAMRWNEISSTLKKIGIKPILEVIGGSDLYDFEKGHKYIPCSNDYGDRIYDHIKDEINKTIFFHGTLKSDRYKIMKDCDIAIFNPRGHGEAFPATILEWMSLSIPVISCLNYGCADVMTYNKFLTINNEKEIANKLLEFSKLQQNEIMELKRLSFIISNYFSSNQESIVYQWILLFNQKNKHINEYLDHRIIRTTIINRFIFVFKNIIYKIFQYFK